MRSKFAGLGLVVGVLLTGLAAPANAGLIANVSAGYSVSLDNSFFVINNVSGTTLTGISISGIGISGTATGLTGTISIPNISAGGTFNYNFAGSGNVFQFDFDDFYTGEARYTVTATSGANVLTTVFSPSTNLSGTFVGFLGNAPNGRESDLNVPATLVGQLVDPVAAVPEPSGFVMASLALIVTPVGYAWRRRKITRG